MAVEDYEDDYADDGLVRRLRKEIKDRDAALKERDERLAALEKQVRQRTVKDVLSAKGLNPKIAAFIPADVESSEDAVTAWVAEYADVFGIAVESDSPASKPAQQFYADEEMAGLEAMGRVTGTGVPMDMAQSLESQIANAASRDELLAFLRSQQ